MKPNSNYCICSLSNSFTDDVVINVLDITSLSAKLILCIHTSLMTGVSMFFCFTFITLPIFVLFNMICKSMSLCHFGCLGILLLNMLLNILLTSWDDFFVFHILTFWSSINNSSSLPRLQMSVLILNVLRSNLWTRCFIYTLRIRGTKILHRFSELICCGPHIIIR